MGHDALFWEVAIAAIPNLILLGVIWTEHRLMWADYRYRKRINGKKEG